MQYAPSESANAALAIVINLLDVLTEHGLIGERQRRAVFSNAVNDLKENTVSNNDARRVLTDISKARYGES